MTPDPAQLPPLVRRFFELAPLPDSDEYFALFADDAVVEDEGDLYHGIAGVRRWRGEVPLVNYEITAIEQAPGGLVVTVTISGDFAGSPITGLAFRFEDLDDRRIHTLRIV